MVVTFAIFAACSDGGGSGPGPDATETAAAFETARDGLRDDLEAYGANIGSLPDDLRAALLNKCRELEAYASQDAVDDICSAVQRAIDDADPGLIDLVLNELSALTPE